MTKCRPMTITDLSSTAEDHDFLCMGSNVPNQPKELRHPRAPLTLSQSDPAD